MCKIDNIIVKFADLNAYQNQCGFRSKCRFTQGRTQSVIIIEFYIVRDVIITPKMGGYEHLVEKERGT
jgi:hypothetical protein